MCENKQPLYYRDYTQLQRNKMIINADLDELQKAMRQAMIEKEQSLIRFYSRKGSKNFKHLLSVFDKVAREWAGTIEGFLDYDNFDAYIVVTLPFFEVSLPMLVNLSEAYLVSFMPKDNKLQLTLYVPIFSIYDSEAGGQPIL